MKDFIQQIFEDHKDILFIQGKNKGKVPYSNSLIIADHLIDTGVSPLHLNKLKRKFKLTKVIFSHWHDDHIRDNKIFAELPFYCHLKSKPIIENINKLLDLYAIRGTPVEEKFKLFLSKVIDVYNTKIEGTFENGAILTIGNYDIHIIYTPGHSIGHCAFYIPILDFAFIGDIDLSKFGPWYGGLDSDIDDFINSIDKIINLKLKTVVSGHRGLIKGQSLIKKELNKYKSIFIKREEKILSYLKEKHPLNGEDLLEKNIIYKNYSFFKPFLLAMEKTMIQKHLERMKIQNTISQYREGYILS